ncbi:carboxylesterase/lipase family protein [Streptacidiphilus griseoplanus]|uniref:carboxylesterase/lipase family protein n=1 Tax=Peterkaempfera griseoplana TaxID=66896 RepID=UPI0006E18817|nr:carboxylesterase family protein [Peterkaempfera griseoplana]
MRAFLGIPYAAPPFGAGRFREPRPAAVWSGVRECREFGPVAPQSVQLPGMRPWAPGDEDVLTLSVWAPEGGGPRPVLLWIHGGAYAFGSSSQPDHDGTVLARAGLVVVGCNYRLGFEGFGQVPGRPANRGLLDQVAALRWIRENIEAFGGDPGNVTVAGQSAGAGSAVCLTAMEEARGLFHRVIAHSVPDDCGSPAAAAGITGRVAAAAGVEPTAEGLCSAAPEALLRASDVVARDWGADPASGALRHNTVLYGPVVDGAVLPGAPLSRPWDPGLDLLVCHTTEEWWLMRETGQALRVETVEELDRAAEELGLPAELPAGYRRLMPGADPGEVYTALLGDAVFAEHSRRVAEHHAAGGGRTYLACFDRRRVTPGGGRTRAWHCADVPFAFGTLDRPETAFLLGGPPDEADRALSHRMVRAWAGFAATGDPGWPRLAPDTAAPVRAWAVPEDGAAPAGTPFRALWRDAFPATG